MQQPPPYSPPGAGGAPPPAAMVSKVDMTVSCEGLRDADVFSKSDPICVLYSLDGNRKREVIRIAGKLLLYSVYNNLPLNFIVFSL